MRAEITKFQNEVRATFALVELHLAGPGHADDCPLCLSALDTIERSEGLIREIVEAET